MENKTQIFNLIILDKSGSMTSIRKAAVDGLNETINGIRKAQLKHMDCQQHYLTIHTFCGCEQTAIYDATPIAEVDNIQPNNYQPCCNTPLYDAIGMTLNKMIARTKKLKNYAVVVTIITDGMENASHEFSGKQVAKLISDQREEGWTFAYMGADHDVEAVARTMNIVNTFTFSHDSEGTGAAYQKDNMCREVLYDRISCCLSRAEESDRKAYMKNLSDNFYNEID